MQKNIFQKLIHYPYCNRLYFLLRYRFAFKKVGKKCYVSPALKITPQYIELGSNVCIGRNCRMEGVLCYEGVKYNPLIVVGNGVSIEQNLHLTCAQRVVIGDNTAIAANVSITDIHHPYDDVNISIERQQLQVKPVAIGADCKIYNNVVILPGITIGRHVTIGANAVVNKDIPDYSVAVGVPARVVKRYNFEKQVWEKES